MKFRIRSSGILWVFFWMEFSNLLSDSIKM